MSDNDALRLIHMRDAAQEVIEFITNINRANLDDDKKTVRAISMSIGIIGEAASRLSNAFTKSHTEIPWAQIVGMRNFLIHEYFRVDLDLLWGTATQDIPQLLRQLNKIITHEENDSSSE